MTTIVSLFAGLIFTLVGDIGTGFVGGKRLSWSTTAGQVNMRNLKLKFLVP